MQNRSLVCKLVTLEGGFTCVEIVELLSGKNEESPSMCLAVDKVDYRSVFCPDTLPSFLSSSNL